MPAIPDHFHDVIFSKTITICLNLLVLLGCFCSPHLTLIWYELQQVCR